MALHIGRKRRATTKDTPRRRFRPRRPGRRTTPPADDNATKTVVVERKSRWWPRGRQNPISAIILAAGWAAVVILALGLLLTWSNANPGNTLVDATLDTGRWLATPFHDLFTRTDPEEQRYINWTVAAVAYYLLARVLSWVTRF